MTVPAKPDGTVLRRSAQAPLVSLERLAPRDAVLIICPHPDDETLGCGQALAGAVRAGKQVGIVLLTDGEASHSGSTRYDRAALKRLRKAEFEQALSILFENSVVPVLRLRLPDGRANPRDLTERQLARVLDFGRRLGEFVVWSTWREDPHCDHACAAEIASIVAERVQAPLWSFPVWGRFGERILPKGMVRFDDPTLSSIKRRAIDAYASQLTDLIDDDPDAFVMPAALTRHFAEHPELFIRER